MLKEISYNKKGNIQFLQVECLPIFKWLTLFYMNKCHFFIAKTNKVKSNKMRKMRLKSLIIKDFIFILSNLLSIRDSVDTQQLNVSYKQYIKKNIRSKHKINYL